MGEKQKITTELIDELYAQIADDVRDYLTGRPPRASASDSLALGYPLGEIVGIGRALYLASIGTIRESQQAGSSDGTPTRSQCRSELRDIASSLLSLAAKQGNGVAEFYHAFYHNVHEDFLLKRICAEGNENDNELRTKLADLKLIADKVLSHSKLNDAYLVLAHAYYFGCGVAKSRNKAETYLFSSALLHQDTSKVDTYTYLHAQRLADKIEREKRMEQRKKVFVSYSHKDKQFEEELRLHLQGMAYSGIVEYWDDKHLKPGDEIDQTIAYEMAKAKFIIMMVSSDYMASWYVRKKEFDELINAAKDEGATIYWVPVRQTMVKGTALDNINAVFDKNKSLASTRDFPERADRDKEYAKIAEQIYNALNQ